MFLKLTENDTGADVYLNPNFIIRFIPNSAGEGTLLFMQQDAGVADRSEAQIVHVHESAEEVFRIISRHEKPGASQSKRGLI